MDRAKAFESRSSKENPPVHLNAGEIIFGRGQREIRTLLGSCISIVLWHPSQHYCGVCHFAMPEHPRGISDNKLDARYADHCMELFRRFAEGKQTQLSQYQAKIFGGGNMLRHFNPPFKMSPEDSYLERVSIGEKNAAAAFSLLMIHQVKILVADVGEQCYRKLYIDTQTAEVAVLHRSVGK
ncbi:chemotaxis protein CheD [Celerinatantimonas sp. YJH-8]|uniref:chemotaxis protein CheD n=1 Tax=Celerinatantimonas sp. YJH-8 TaxID=3228714 RepID=UPI0038C0A66F